jgi:hypothetical protein
MGSKISSFLSYSVATPISKEWVLVFFLCSTLNVFAQDLQFDEFKRKGFRRGHEYTIRWSGGGKGDILTLELTTSSGVVQRWDNIQNTGQYKVKLDPKLELDRAGTFRMQTQGSSVYTYTKKFQIRRKQPVVLIIAAVAAIQSTIVVIATFDPLQGNGYLAFD